MRCTVSTNSQPEHVPIANRRPVSSRLSCKTVHLFSVFLGSAKKSGELHYSVAKMAVYACWCWECHSTTPHDKLPEQAGMPVFGTAVLKKQTEWAQWLNRNSRLLNTAQRTSSSVARRSSGVLARWSSASSPACSAAEGCRARQLR